ncbi:PhoH family protein [Candidatus Formimonas warabiya]|uniref:PIN domain-containing protein n=1 Tax=Formimonas warabiya TaxID=1761012 RepID=A0A3G1KUE6_FORW1|nr:PhoH family protein [Candidatus Formimonas warabiya]ATW26044.1 hypothetical protein DCMF_15810 [Candidatus Formimonas warabiya]
MKKIYVLDTSVLLQNPQALLSFEDNTVVIPEVVIEELDNKKADQDPEIKANVRWIARFLDGLRQQETSLYEGVKLPGGGSLKVEMNCLDVKLPETWKGTKADNRILAVAKGLQRTGQPVAIVTKDIFMRIKADTIQVEAQDFKSDQVVDLSEQYTGWEEVRVSAKKIETMYREGVVPWSKKELPNKFFILKNRLNPKQSVLGKYTDKKIVLLRDPEPNFYGFKLNTLQKFAREALLDDSVPLVTISGATGSGKTLLALGVGLEKVDARTVRRMLICRPNIGMGEDIGLLPGREEEKIAPYMRPIIDNLEQLIDSKPSYDSDKEINSKVSYLFDKRVIVTEAIQFLQGRSIVKQWIFIDEAQNLTPKQAKGIVTRAGEGSKVVLVGDPEQINHPFLDARTNGLSFTIEMMKGSTRHSHITLSETKRSLLAMEAGNRMK